MLIKWKIVLITTSHRSLTAYCPRQGGKYLCYITLHLPHTMQPVEYCAISTYPGGTWSLERSSKLPEVSQMVTRFSSVQSLSRVRLFVTPWITAHQASLSITNSWSSPNPCVLSWWCHPTISSSVVPFSCCPQSSPASGFFPMSQLFASGGQSIGVSASTSVPPMNTQDWFPLKWTCWISLKCKGLTRVFSNTTVQKHPFFGA